MRLWLTPLLFATSIARAESLAAPPVEPPFSARIQEAVQIRQSGQNATALTFLEALEPQVPAEYRGLWLYQRGICAEVAWDYEAAVALHQGAIDAGGEFVLDARYRQALSLEALGRDAEAVDAIRELARARGLDNTDRLAIAIQKATTEVKAGKRWRGTRHLNAALADAEAANLHTYLQAKAHAALAAAHFADAAELRLRGSEKRLVKRLKERAALITAGEDEILKIIELDEVEWVLASLLDIGAAYEALGSELEAVAPPRGEDPAAYAQALAPYVNNVRTKARNIYGLGIELAVRLGWESPRVAKLREEKARLGG